MLRGNGHQCVPLEWRAARDHLVKHNPKTENVAARINLPATGLFGRHVLHCAHHQAGGNVHVLGSSRLRRRLLLFGEFGQTKIQHLYVAVVAQHDVFRLDVAMDDSCFVRSCQSAGDLDCDIECLS